MPADEPLGDLPVETRFSYRSDAARVAEENGWL
jgi:hypothetical protein